MRIDSIHVRNFRTLADIEVTLSDSYTAICGANDAGKTNVIRTLRHLFEEGSDRPTYFLQDDSDDISIKDDYTKWNSRTDPQEVKIEISATIVVSSDRDAGLYQSITKQLSISAPPSDLRLRLDVVYAQEKLTGQVTITVDDIPYSGIDADEVLNRIRTARCIQFHNSTEGDRFGPLMGTSTQQDLSSKDISSLERAHKSLNGVYRRLAKGRQKAIEEYLARLELPYKVGVSLPRFEPDYLPFKIAMGEKQYDIKLEDWGSGTRNQTFIIQRLIAAQQVSTSEASATKVTPVIVIEEPESFLHPHAQARLGRTLQDLSTELDVQVVVTTHSPYMLSTRDPSMNVLLRRTLVRNRARQTERVSITEENWMAPFAQALGFDSVVFEPWKELFSGGSDNLLLVEGKLDKEYLELLRNEAHGDKRLKFGGDIVAYDGTGTLSNPVLLSLLKNRCRRMFVTFDLDSEKEVTKALRSIGLERQKDFLPVGINAPGRRNIEGLLPKEIRTRVRQVHTDWADALESGTKDEREQAKSALKKGYLDEFKRRVKPGDPEMADLYKLTDSLNRCLSRKGS